MSIVKNKAMMFSMLMLLSAFALAGTPALAASKMGNTHDTKDVCAEVEDMDNVQDENDNEADDAEENDAEDLCEQTESAKLAKVVKISEIKARQIAESNHSGKGKITEVLLARDEDENNVSRIVYEIEFTESNGNEVDVKVDANTGKYLGVDTEDDENDGEELDDAEKGNETTSNTNVQVLQAQLVSLLQQLIALLKA